MVVLTRAPSPAPSPARITDLALAALAPASWGTTFVVTTTLLPAGRPLLAATLRALPAGLVLVAAARRLPYGPWWWRSAVLGTLNFGAFFPLLFLAAYRLPGGVAATIGSIQPLVVALFSILILRATPARATLYAALAGTAGVALLTLTAKARLDPVGIAAMLSATSLMGLAIVLAKKWGRPEAPLAAVGWQLTFGGLVLAPLTLTVEGLPTSLSTGNVLGFLYLGGFGTALAYVLWFRGIDRMAPTSVSLLGLTNPLVATLLGLVVLGQTLTGWQLLGFAIALGALVAGQLHNLRAARVQREPAEHRAAAAGVRALHGRDERPGHPGVPGSGPAEGRDRQPHVIHGVTGDDEGFLPALGVACEGPVCEACRAVAGHGPDDRTRCEE